MGIKKLIHGFGINNANYKTRVLSGSRYITCPYYKVWCEVLRRCYSDKWHTRKPTYRDCTVVRKWKYFMSFRSWMVEQDWQHKQIDKDIIEPGNKVYGPNTCCFVTPSVHGVMNRCSPVKGSYPKGVCVFRDGFKAQISISGKNKWLGDFTNIKDAESAYRKAKSNNLRNIAGSLCDARIRDGILRHASLIEAGT